MVYFEYAYRTFLMRGTIAVKSYFLYPPSMIPLNRENSHSETDEELSFCTGHKYNRLL